MKVDYKQFPDIPAGYSTNYNKARDVYQVYRDVRVYDEVLKKKVTKRETIGQIKNGVFTYSKLHLARQKNEQLQQELDNKNQRTLEQAQSVAQKITDVVVETRLDQRQQSKVQIPIEPIVLAALMSALSGATDCVAISQLLNDHGAFFRRLYPGLPEKPVTHDAVYRSLLKIKPEQLNAFYQRIIEHLVAKSPDKAIAGDGQACRATRKKSKNSAYMLMNFYDNASRLCLSHMLIEDKANEITVGPGMLEAMDIKGSIITADAMSCQMDFVNSVLSGGADYCLAVKGNQDKSFKELRSLFMSTHPDQIEVHCEDPQLDHGRIEQRTVSLIGGNLLSTPLKQKWTALEQGCVVRVRSQRTYKSTGHTETDERFYISSLPLHKRTAQRLGEVVRAHWSVENRLHWVLDMHFDQDQMQASDPDYISNRVALNKLALAMVENYRYWLWESGKTGEVLSIKSAMRHCQNFDNALNCLAWSQGFV